ncbi:MULTISPECIES: flap endonuclease Xni [unclassified Pseudoalteromonas]|uniref:flap endonuclease Xni n=1 Tax=unclassified Pseudoalteromonas TaxID=194690 RepID=UPI0030149C26
MKPRLLLIDALNLIRRIYAVHEPKSATEQEVHLKACCLRVEKAVRSLLNKMAASHAVAVFDGERSWRYEFYPNYKMNRQPMPETLKNNLDKFMAAFAAAGVSSFSPDNDEADDVIATLASKAAEAGIAATVVSTDKGFLPLLSEQISVYDHFKKSFITSEDVKSRFSVSKEKLTLFWALSGDRTNDIPGVSGIGIKTAKELLARFNDYDAMLSAEQLTESQRGKLQAGGNDFVVSLALVTLRQDIELGFSLKDLRIS